MDQCTFTPEGEMPLVARIASGFWVSQALYVIAKLGVADRLADGPLTSEDLAVAVAAHPGALRRALRALASVGVFTEDGQGRWALTSAAESLRSDRPGSLRAFVTMLGEPESWRAWGEFLHSVRTGQSAFERVFGEPVFSYMATHPDAAALFDAAMAERSRAEDAAVLDAYDIAAARLIIDIGGGRGALLAAALQRHAHLQGVLFDLPHVIDAVRQSAPPRCELRAGDFFGDPLPSDGDVYLLKKVIHDWDDERALTILRACRRAMSNGAKLLLIEPVVPPGNGPAFAKLLDLFMLVWPGGQERTEAEHRALLASAGLAVNRIVPTASPVSVIEARPA